MDEHVYEEIGAGFSTIPTILQDGPFCRGKPPNVTGVDTCSLCGTSEASVRCDKCCRQAFCTSCDEMFHRHPDRISHIRHKFGSYQHTACPPLPPKPDRTPVPPPRRNKRSFKFFGKSITQAQSAFNLDCTTHQDHAHVSLDSNNLVGRTANTLKLHTSNTSLGSMTGVSLGRFQHEQLGDRNKPRTSRYARNAPIDKSYLSQFDLRNANVEDSSGSEFERSESPFYPSAANLFAGGAYKASLRSKWNCQYCMHDNADSVDMCRTCFHEKKRGHHMLPKYLPQRQRSVSPDTSYYYSQSQHYYHASSNIDETNWKYESVQRIARPTHAISMMQLSESSHCLSSVQQKRQNYVGNHQYEQTHRQQQHHRPFLPVYHQRRQSPVSTTRNKPLSLPQESLNGLSMSSSLPRQRRFHRTVQKRRGRRECGGYPMSDSVIKHNKRKTPQEHQRHRNDYAEGIGPARSNVYKDGDRRGLSTSLLHINQGNDEVFRSQANLGTQFFEGGLHKRGISLVDLDLSHLEPFISRIGDLDNESNGTRLPSDPLSSGCVEFQETSGKYSSGKDHSGFNKSVDDNVLINSSPYNDSRDESLWTTEFITPPQSPVQETLDSETLDLESLDLESLDLETFDPENIYPETLDLENLNPENQFSATRGLSLNDGELYTPEDESESPAPVDVEHVQQVAMRRQGGRDDCFYGNIYQVLPNIERHTPVMDSTSEIYCSPPTTAYRIQTSTVCHRITGVEEKKIRKSVSGFTHDDNILGVEYSPHRAILSSRLNEPETDGILKNLDAHTGFTNLSSASKNNVDLVGASSLDIYDMPMLMGSNNANVNYVSSIVEENLKKAIRLEHNHLDSHDITQVLTQCTPCISTEIMQPFTNEYVNDLMETQSSTPLMYATLPLTKINSSSYEGGNSSFVDDVLAKYASTPAISDGGEPTESYRSPRSTSTDSLISVKYTGGTIIFTSSDSLSDSYDPVLNIQYQPGRMLKDQNRQPSGGSLNVHQDPASLLQDTYVDRNHEAACLPNEHDQEEEDIIIDDPPLLITQLELVYTDANDIYGYIEKPAEIMNISEHNMTYEEVPPVHEEQYDSSEDNFDDDADLVPTDETLLAAKQNIRSGLAVAGLTGNRVRHRLHNRAFNMLQSGKASCKVEAERASQLMELRFAEQDSLNAAAECSNLYSAINYLHQTCQLCEGRFSVAQMVSMTYCTHKCCMSCAVTYFTQMIKERALCDLRCPFCNEPDLADEEVASTYFSHLDIVLKALLPAEVHSLYQKKLLDRAVTSDPNFKWCPKCSSGFFINGNTIRMDCPDCKFSSCVDCKKQWLPQHEGITCDQFRLWQRQNDPEYQSTGLERHLALNGISCPHCQFRYLLAKGGCMHFTCSMCRYEFCSGCGFAFVLGSKCGKTDYCAKLGLHAHHPRNCLFYLRDYEPQLLQNLLKEHAVSFDTEPSESAISTQLYIKTDSDSAGGQRDSTIMDYPTGHESQQSAPNGRPRNNIDVGSVADDTPHNVIEHSTESEGQSLGLAGAVGGTATPSSSSTEGNGRGSPSRKQPASQSLSDCCKVLEQKETENGLHDAICGRVVVPGHAGLCRMHYIEYLSGLIWKHRLDPISISDAGDLCQELRRHGQRPRSQRIQETPEEYVANLRKHVLSAVPL